MHDSVAAIRAGRPRTRFASQGSHRGERRLGLRTASRPLLSAAATRPSVAHPSNALRQAARSLAGVREAARRPAAQSPTGLLRRTGTITWSSRAQADRRQARPRSAAPWRG